MGLTARLTLGLWAAWSGRVEAAEVCVAWGDAGALIDGDVDAAESSGVAASVQEEGLYYTLNDAGGEASLYLFDEAGGFRGEELIQGATNTDWEDLAAGPCPPAVAAEACLYIADIGDNDEDRDDITIWVVPDTAETIAEKIADAVACPVAYPDGPRDAETLLVAPADAETPGTVRIVTKENDGEARIFKAGVLTCGATPDRMSEEARVVLDGPATGGVMTAATVVIRTLSSAWLWQDCGIDASTWLRQPEPLDLGSDPQGEAIGVTADGGFITTSESSPFRFRLIRCAEMGEPKCSGCGCTSGSDRGAGAGSWILLAWVVAGGRRGRPS